MKVYWTASARHDLESTVLYLAERSPQAALSTLERLHIREYRELVVAPYRVIYRVQEPRVFVLGVFDGRRSLEDVLLERLIRFEAEPG